MSRIIEIVDSDDDGPSIATSYNNTVDSNEGSPAQSRRRPRKSALQAMANPEVQFAVQTIAIEDDDNNCNPHDNPTNDSLARSQQRTAKMTPKILAPKPPSMGANIQSAFEEYIDTLEATECIATIALERVRVNYLLSMFGMPEINFSLYTKKEVLKFQFEERLKQQRMMQNLKGSDNRGRTSLQNNKDQEIS